MSKTQNTQEIAFIPERGKLYRIKKRYHTKIIMHSFSAQYHASDSQGLNKAEKRQVRQAINKADKRIKSHNTNERTSNVSLP